MTIKVGDKLETWFSDQPNKLSTVLAILPYRGRYTDMFDCVLILSAPRTNLGSLEMAYSQKWGTP